MTSMQFSCASWSRLEACDSTRRPVAMRMAWSHGKGRWAMSSLGASDAVAVVTASTLLLGWESLSRVDLSVSPVVLRRSGAKGWELVSLVFAVCSRVEADRTVHSSGGICGTSIAARVRLRSSCAEWDWGSLSWTF